MPNHGEPAHPGPAASPSVDRALAALECLAEHRDGLAMTELGRRLGVAKSSLHAILATMQARGFVDRDPVTKRYTLGARHDDLLSAFQDLARSLAARTGETVQLAVLRGRHACYVGKQDGTHQVRLASTVGSQLPAHATALGKALLSDLPEADLDALFAGVALEPVTAQTITSLARLKRELARVRADGYAVDRGETLPEVRCVAAPVRGGDGTVAAAISVSVPVFRIDDRREAELAREIRACAAELSLRLGHAKAGPLRDTAARAEAATA
jgi:IclR family acetate operon transcriptional repressor